MKTLNPSQKKYLKTTFALAKRHGVSMFLSKHRSVKLGPDSRSNGYFNEEYGTQQTPRLAVATNHPVEHWFGILLHESSHMDQWIEKSPYWDYSAPGEPEIYSRWLGRGRFTTAAQKKKAHRIIDKYILLEADCEIRSANKIKALELALDYERYCQKANAYIYFYQAMKGTRRWYTVGKEPYHIEEIVSAMPKKMLKTPEDYLNVSKDILNLYYKHYTRRT